MVCRDDSYYIDDTVCFAWPVGTTVKQSKYKKLLDEVSRQFLSRISPDRACDMPIQEYCLIVLIKLE